MSEGEEELLNARSLKRPVAVPDWDAQKSVIDLREEARAALKKWERLREHALALEEMRDSIRRSLGDLGWRE